MNALRTILRTPARHRRLLLAQMMEMTGHHRATTILVWGALGLVYVAYSLTVATAPLIWLLPGAALWGLAAVVALRSAAEALEPTAVARHLLQLHLNAPLPFQAQLDEDSLALRPWAPLGVLPLVATPEPELLATLATALLADPAARVTDLARMTPPALPQPAVVGALWAHLGYPRPGGDRFADFQATAARLPRSALLTDVFATALATATGAGAADTAETARQQADRAIDICRAVCRD